MIKTKKTSILESLTSQWKLLGIFIFFLSFLFISNFIEVGITLTAIVILIFLSKLSLKESFSNLKLIWILLISITVINLFILQNLYISVIIVITRLLGAIFSLSILLKTTKVKELGWGIEFWLAPLKVIKFPYREVTTMILLTFRFLPEVREEMDNIVNAQICRGLDIKDTFLGRIKALLPLAINIFIVTIRRSFAIAMAMDARGYKDRIIIKRKTRLNFGDFIFITFFTLLLSFNIIF